MSTIQNDPSPSGPKPASDKGGSKLMPIALVAIIALLALAGYLFYRNSELSNEKEQISSQLDESAMLKREVEQQYYESLAELEEMRGSNEELNDLIDEQKAELMASKERIDALSRDSRNYNAARKELAQMKEQMTSYVAEINELREENGLLAEQNTDLSTANEGLQRTVSEATAQNEELTEARAALLSEKEELSTSNAFLSNRVTMASVVNVGEIDVTGLRLKDNGKTVRKKYAKNVDLLNICFETTNNPVTDPGNEIFYVRLINSLGETLAVEEMGSGVLENALTKEQVRYTKAAEHQYQNDENEVCVTWDTPVQLQKGEYDVEVYNKGYIAGKGEFKLK